MTGLRGIRRKDLTTEIVAGITLAALAIPLNIGYAQIAGLPPIVGLYAAIVPVAVFAVFSSSRQLVASPDAPIAALIGSLLVAIVPASSKDYVQLAYAQALVCAIVFFLFFIFRLGFLANFLSEPVLVGFIAGLAVEILTSQVKKILDITVDDDHYFAELYHMVLEIPHAHWWNVAVGVGTIAAILLFRRIWPRSPASLFALIAATGAVMVFDLGDRGVDVLGKVPSGLPSLHWPDVSLTDWLALVPGAIAICAVTLADGLLTARKYGEAHDYPVDANRELFAFGAANVAAGFTGGFAVGSSASRTAATDAAGSRWQLPSLVSTGVVAVVVATLSGLLADLPNAALAAVVAVAVIKLVDVRKLTELYRVRRSDFVVAMICLLGVPVLGSLAAVVIAALLSALDFVRRAASPNTALLQPGEKGRFVAIPGSQTGAKPSVISVRVPNETSAPAPPGGMMVYRFGAPLFFGNSEVFKTELTNALATLPRGGWFVLDAEAITDIDTTGAQALAASVTKAKEQGITFTIARASSPTRELLQRYGLIVAIGATHLYESNEAALDAFRASRS